jgi:lipoprotein-releasing system permease protein
VSRLYEVFIALRILKARRRAFLSVVSLISMLGVILGVTALTVILSVSGGFQRAIREKVLGFYPHIVILKRAGDFRDYREMGAALRDVPVVRGVSPATYDEMMAAVGDRRAGVVVKGVDLETVRTVSDLDAFVTRGPDGRGPGLEELAEEPPVARPPGARVVNAGELVAGTAWTVLALPGGGASAVRDDPTTPEPERARLRLVHALPDAPPLTLALDGPQPEDTPPAAWGEGSRYVDLEPGLRTLELRPASGGEALAALTVDLAPNRTWTVLASPPAAAPGTASDAPEPALTLVADDYLPLEGETAQARLLHADPAAPPLALALADDAPGPAAAPRTASAYAPGRSRLPGVLVAADLAERLHARRGDVLTLVSPLRGLGNRMLAPYGMAPTAGRFRVVGTFRVGYFEYDTRFVVIDFAAARRFLNRGDVPRWLEVRVADALLVKEQSVPVKAAVDPYDIGTFLEHVAASAALVREIVREPVQGHELEVPRDVLDVLRNHAAVLGLLRYQDLEFGYRERYKLIDWEDTYRYLFSSLKLQKVVLSVFFLIIVLVASFNIIGSQVMVVHEKLRDIAILRSMGARASGIRRIFLIQGMVIGVAGTSIGLVCGWLACHAVRWTGFELDPKVYYISQLPVDMDPLEFALTGAAALVFTFLASRYSANRAADRTPVEGLRRLD